VQVKNMAGSLCGKHFVLFVLNIIRQGFCC